MKTIFLGLTLISSLAFAESATVSLSGMHCAGCKHEIREKVCNGAEAKEKYETCLVEFTSQKEQKGEIKITAKKDVKLDLALVKAGIKAAGEDYKITKEEVKN